MTRHAKGICCILCSATCFALMSVFVRLSGDIPSMQKSFFRNAVAALFALFIVLRDRKNAKISKKDLPLLFLRSAVGTIGIVANFYAIDHMALADANILNKISPFCTLIFSAIFLKEKFSLKQGLLVLGAFIGVLFVVKPSFDNPQAGPALIALTGGIAAGGAYTTVRALGKRGVPGPLIVLFFSTFSCLVVVPFIIADHVPMTGYQLGMLLMAGLCASGGQFSITAAYKFAPASELSIYDYSQILVSAACGYFFFAQLPDMWSFIGYAMIITMAVLMFQMNRKKHVLNS